MAAKDNTNLVFNKNEDFNKTELSNLNHRLTKVHEGGGKKPCIRCDRGIKIRVIDFCVECGQYTRPNQNFYASANGYHHTQLEKQLNKLFGLCMHI